MGLAGKGILGIRMTRMAASLLPVRASGPSAGLPRAPSDVGCRCRFPNLRDLGDASVPAALARAAGGALAPGGPRPQCRAIGHCRCGRPSKPLPSAA